jgi:spore coat protein U-like protein
MRMASTTAGVTSYLNYALYQDAGYNTVWGNVAGSWLTTTAATNKQARTYTVYGQIPGGQDEPAGSYTDTVVATVNF